MPPGLSTITAEHTADLLCQKRTWGNNLQKLVVSELAKRSREVGLQEAYQTPPFVHFTPPTLHTHVVGYTLVIY